MDIFWRIRQNDLSGCFVRDLWLAISSLYYPGTEKVHEKQIRLILERYIWNIGARKFTMKLLA